MARPSDILGESILSRGIRVRPIGGVGRASRGYVTEATAEAVTLSPAPLIDGDLLKARFYEVYRSPFWHPDREYTGYAANGYWYTAGELDPTHVPFKASWAEEGEVESSTRGPQDSFPRRILVLLSFTDLRILDADTLTLWMKFSLSRSSPPANGPFLGSAVNTLRSVTFANGFLVVATSNGLRIANFRSDEAYFYSTSGSSKSTGGLENRNEPTFMDGAPLAAVLGSANCLDVDARDLSSPSGSDKRVYTVCACGHAGGFDGIVLSKPGITYPAVKSTLISRTIATAWEIADDGSSATLSSHFTDTGTNWVGFSVYPGDTITTDGGHVYTIHDIDQVIPGSRLELEVPAAIGTSGAGYTITRHVPAVRVDAVGALVFANGEGAVTRIESADWYEGVTPVFANLSTGHPTSRFAAITKAVNDLTLLGSTGFYVASDVGVFYGSYESLTNARLVEYRYSTAAVVNTEPQYKILQGEGSACLAVAVDPETGNVLVSTADELRTTSVVTEINPSYHQAFRFFDQVGLARTIIAYRNPLGPPDKEI